MIPSTNSLLGETYSREQGLHIDVGQKVGPLAGFSDVSVGDLSVYHEDARAPCHKSRVNIITCNKITQS